MPEKRDTPAPRFAETPAEREERLYNEKRERSRAKVAGQFPATTAKVADIAKRLGIGVRIVGLIEDGKIIGKMEADTIAEMTKRNGGPLTRIDPNPDKDD